jgi:hypothetical protein
MDQEKHDEYEFRAVCLNKKMKAKAKQINKIKVSIQNRKVKKNKI